MGGSKTIPSSSTGAGSCGQSGVDGAFGTAAPGNIPGARNGGVSWTDSKGNLWLFGGEGDDSAGVVGSLNDLWEYSPSANEWTWMGGSSALPACSSSGSCGESGVYGTQGSANAANSPGGRGGAVGWTDTSGNLWMFGGGGFDETGTAGKLNDLWVFNTSTNQ
jgi:N-acetylneuraminic acid mutarotase